MVKKHLRKGGIYNDVKKKKNFLSCLPKRGFCKWTASFFPPFYYILDHYKQEELEDYYTHVSEPYIKPDKKS